ncbi:ribosomal protein S7 domain-containing protein [Lasiosphaeria miniovina]|uniref:Small ribosomal subunit protein uS7m n=1 Tax=Lasiosphaeria miniovina TaxID=1954250 RepID=A0AA40DRP2_9PEZI|nr:ribosomal protein S7 domain-containing protein [Lasiosphaeria miniovina]KAK0709503.1 ribosomal protein S7 domain-containing protein [Lasiosphaeria miniovina]
MPPRLKVWAACRALSIRPRPLSARPPLRCAAVPVRTFADSTNTTNTTPAVPASKLPEGYEDPEPESQAKKNESEHDDNVLQALDKLKMISYGLNPFDPAVEGHKYGLPQLPLPSPMHMKHRYDDVVVQLTKLIMRDGKLSKAQRDMAMILNYLRTSPPPKINPSKPLMPGSPPAAHLPLDPITYITIAIDSVAPLVRVRALAGAAGGGKALDIPVPLAARQRRRMAFQWILDVVEKKPSKGSGRGMFPTRVAEEIVAVVEGRSGVWDKRFLLHKQATSARANLNYKAPPRRH